MAASTVAIWNTVESLPSQDGAGCTVPPATWMTRTPTLSTRSRLTTTAAIQNGNDLEPGQRDEGRGEQQLVGDGIEEGAEPRLRAPAPRDVAVEQIGEARQAEHEQGQPSRAGTPAA